MTRLRPPRHLAAALCIAAASALPAAGSNLQIKTAAGESLGQIPMAAGQEVCLAWAHSVTGGAVRDCFENRAGALMLTRSYLHDFAAGLGEIPGRGRLVPAPGGGYWITGIDEPLPGNILRLRVGGPQIGHELSGEAGALDLSRVAAGQSVTLRLAPPE